MLRQIFIINGCGGVGKDTFIKICRNLVKNPPNNIIAETLTKENLKIKAYSSVTKIKKIARTCGWDGGKTEKDRKFLADFKTLCTEYNDLPMKDMLEYINKINAKFDNTIMFIAIREPEEIKKAVYKFRAFNPKTILVTNNNIPHISSNHADNDVYKYDYDIHVNNSGTKKDLRYIATDFLTDYSKNTLKSEY